MPTISAFYGLIIQMFFKDHHRNLVLDWAKLHQAELLENWRLCQNMQNPKPIAPLE